MDTHDLSLFESIRDRFLDVENIGWRPLNRAITDEADSGPDLDALKRVSVHLREMASSNPWHIRGAQLRHSYVFGRGATFSGIDKPAVQRALADPTNRASVFSTDAWEKANLALFTDGNYFVMRRGGKANARFVAVPLKQITGFYTDEDDTSNVWYWRRTWTVNGKEVSRWIPVARYKKLVRGRIATVLGTDKTPVDQDAVMYYKTTKAQTGWALGVPDSFGAVPWTWGYSEYLQNNLTLVKSLSMIAWKYTSGASNASGAAQGMQMDSPGSVGGVAALAAGNQWQSAGVPSAQVNMGNGQPIIAGVATSFGVPVIALLSSPGETGGSYGAATSLDEPTLKGFTALQQSWGDFYQEILSDLGASDVKMAFPAISTDATYRQLQSVAQAHAQGFIWRDEARAAALDMMDVPQVHTTLPKGDGFNNYTDPDAAADSTTSNDPTPRQGNTGAVPGGVDQDDTNNDDAGA